MYSCDHKDVSSNEAARAELEQAAEGQRGAEA